MASTTQYIPADDSDDDLNDEDIPSFSAGTPLLATPDKGKGRAAPELLASPGLPPPVVSGNIDAPGNAPRSSARQSFGGVQVESRYGGIDTLDEPITAPLYGRDLVSIYNKLVQVLYPMRKGAGREVLRWDLWGPLILCLMLGISLAPTNQSLGVFTSVIVIVCVGALVVTIQAKVSAGQPFRSFFQGLCALGYCVAPLDIAALISCFVRIIYIRAPIAILCWAWCIWASANFLDGTKIEPQRILLAVYPLLLFYFILAWMILIQ
ncbi:hypothetical protein BC826DRAFT_1093181 [Russula brevipes]|nr:hypothetical protein BC826DRAFT_1093181 [Russula brevipes]